MATTLMDKEQMRYVKKLHTLSGKAGMDNDTYRSFLWDNYKVNTSKDMNVYELIEACNTLDKLANPKSAEIDTQRKRVIASIGGYLRQIGAGGNDIEKIKAIACRASECDYFNQIPVEKLRAIYYTFLNKQKVAIKSEVEIDKIINDIKNQN